MYRSSGKNAKRNSLNICFFTLLVFVLLACSNAGGGVTTSATPGAGPATAITNAIQQAGVASASQPCPAIVDVPRYWDPIIGTQEGTNQVESVSCANLESNTTQQALVTVRSNGSGGFLDVYVYTRILAPHPQQLFRLQNLAAGNARISAYNTIITSEVDANSSINKGEPDAQLHSDLNREFKWLAAAQAFVQVSFPGIYPDMTRYQAEDEQAQTDQGKQPGLLDAQQVAKGFAKNLLKWTATQATIMQGGGPHDAVATVTIQNINGHSGAITLSMSRLEGNTTGGIWEVTSASTSGMSITIPAAHNKLLTPFTAEGRGSAFEGVIGTIEVLDHLYNTIGQVQVKGAQGNGATTFAVHTSYTSTFTSGSEEGVLVLMATSQADGSVSGVVMQKQLL